MLRRILVWLLPLFVLSLFTSCQLNNATNTSIVYNNAHERKHTIPEKELFKDSFFERNRIENLEENKQKEIAIIEKEDVPIQFFDRTYSIVFFGDSLTEGIGDRTNNGGYTSYIKEYYEDKLYIDNVKETNLGVKGNRTTHLLARLENEEIQSSLQNADVIFITIGGNDLMKVIRENFLSLTFPLFEKEQQLYGARLTEVLEKTRSINENATIYLIGLFNPFYQFFQEIDEFNQVVTDWNDTSISVLNQFNDIQFIQVQDIFLQPEEDLLYDDQFHPNENGYRLIGERVIKMLENTVIREEELERE
ncbi:SGNH/GDSL hydrolase family protein [Sutcliffiella cohnii]|uniref:SGNH hydrolase-type esterase domain-containing protein n=1 Tax=Sutcliffiella cohnii TaxID=33932 RepID=A0A223KQK6_9BACI|nr:MULTISPECIES: SGNH/GDSL hydrolase family protein [Sutcliffiella]AST91749.1 hypothetical protein BC6307_10895 [Sutcliffiella cohnii]MED4014696.1 SGNH/GDSL hydrolase family protein [Sutcliffiella cohnii]WBL12965.1 SGNH/GDSL hydrolase family protein [Sutcliffiella sp. NC1]